MSKVAKLVTITLKTRILVDENADDNVIIKACKPRFIEKVMNELNENIDSVELDIECPYGTPYEDFYYQPDLSHPDVKNDKDFHSFFVFHKPENAKEMYPGVEIIRYYDGDIENPTYID